MTGGGLVGTAFLATWLAAAVRLSGPVLLASLGEIVGERAGVLNVGIEGTILLGALASYLACYATGLAWFGLLAALLAGLIAGLLLGFMYVTVRASQVVVGIVFNVLALGVASFLYRITLGAAATPEIVPNLTFGLVALVHVLLFRTRFGLALRAVGENPKAADAAGIHVARMRYIGVLMSSAGAGMAGAYIVLAQVGLFRDTIVSGEGFIALSIVIFGRWSPWKAAAAALVFGAADALQLSLQLFGSNVPPQLLLSLPYVLTILAISGLFGGKAVQPAALMVPYVKRERRHRRAAEVP